MTAKMEAQQEAGLWGQLAVPFSAGHMADIPVEFSIVVKASDAQLNTNQGRLDALGVMESVFELFAKELSADLILAFAVIAAKTKMSHNALLFPWLPGPERRMEVLLEHDYLSRGLNVDRPLAGQTLPEINAVAASVVQRWETGGRATRLCIDPRHYVFPSHMVEASLVFHTTSAVSLLRVTELASVVLESAMFENGSLGGYIKAKLRILIVALPLIGNIAKPLAIPVIGAMATPVATEQYDHYRFQKEINGIVAGQSCTVYATWKYDLNTLQHNNLEAFNFEAPGLSRIERSERVCNVQLALNVDSGSPGRVDGIWGEQSQESFLAWAKKHGVPADIRNEATRGQLLQRFRENPFSK